MDLVSIVATYSWYDAILVPLSGSVGVLVILLVGVVLIDHLNDRLNNHRSVSVFTKNILLLYQ